MFAFDTIVDKNKNKEEIKFNNVEHLCQKFYDKVEKKRIK